MKARNIISLFVVTLPLAAGSVACGSGPSTGTDEPTAQTAQEQLIANGAAIMAWPAGPVAWNGLTGTWPISVWSPATIGGLAFGVSGLTGFGVTAVGFPGMFAAPITTGMLNAFIPPVAAAPLGAAPFLGPSGLFAPAFGFTGAFNPWVGGAGWGFGLNGFTGANAFNTTFANGAFTPGLNWWVPTLTSSALFFSNLTPISMGMPFTFNLTFHATAAQVTAFNAGTFFPAVSIFGTPILPGAIAASTAAIPFMSIAFPIMPMPIAGFGVGLGGVGTVAPLGGVGIGGVGAVAPLGGVGLGGVGLGGVGLGGVGLGGVGLGGVGLGGVGAVAPVGGVGLGGVGAVAPVL